MCCVDEFVKVGQSHRHHLFGRVIALSVLCLFLLVFIILMWAGASFGNCILLIADTISWSILLGRGTLSSPHKIRHLPAILDPGVGEVPGLAGAISHWVRGWNVAHCQPGLDGALGLGLGLYCCSNCCLCCSLGLCLEFGCSCSWSFSGSQPYIARAFCEASRPPLSCRTVLSYSSIPISSVSDALRPDVLAITFGDMSTMPTK